jgi:hypothetical protein
MDKIHCNKFMSALRNNELYHQTYEMYQGRKWLPDVQQYTNVEEYSIRVWYGYYGVVDVITNEQCDVVLEQLRIMEDANNNIRAVKK